MPGRRARGRVRAPMRGRGRRDWRAVGRDRSRPGALAPPPARSSERPRGASRWRRFATRAIGSRPSGPRPSVSAVGGRGGPRGAEPPTVRRAGDAAAPAPGWPPASRGSSSTTSRHEGRQGAGDDAGGNDRRDGGEPARDDRGSRRRRPPPRTSLRGRGATPRGWRRPRSDRRSSETLESCPHDRGSLHHAPIHRPERRRDDDDFARIAPSRRLPRYGGCSSRDRQFSNEVPRPTHSAGRAGLCWRSMGTLASAGPEVSR